MSIKLGNTSEIKTTGIKMLVYGEAGSGKTTLIRTLPNPIVLSAEAGLLSLRKYGVPFITITSLEDLMEAFTYLTTDPVGTAYESVALDSISEIGEIILSNEKKINTDGRQAYGKLQEKLGDLIRGFRDNLPGRNVFFSAKMEKLQDDKGAMLFAASLPGNKTSQSLPYFFDEVLAMRLELNKVGEPIRMLMCSPDGTWSAKDRSGVLDTWEAPDLGAIIKKINGVVENE